MLMAGLQAMIPSVTPRDPPRPIWSSRSLGNIVAELKKTGHDNRRRIQGMGSLG